MPVSAQEICETFNRLNQKATWSARPNSRDTFDSALFRGPSDLIELSYDALQGKFVVRFVKVQAPFRTYMIAIAKAMTYVLDVLAAGGLPFAPPPSHTAVTVMCALHERDGDVLAWWDGMHVNTVPHSIPEGYTGWADANGPLDSAQLIEEGFLSPLNEPEENNSNTA